MWRAEPWLKARAVLGVMMYKKEEERWLEMRNEIDAARKVEANTKGQYSK